MHFSSSYNIIVGGTGSYIDNQPSGIGNHTIINSTFLSKVLIDTQ